MKSLLKPSWYTCKPCIHPSMFVLLLFLFFTACQSNNNPPPSPPPPAEPVIVQDLTEEQVIEMVKKQLYQSMKTVPIQMHYWRTVMSRKPCDAYDVGYGRSCSEPVPGAPYGYKNVPEQVKECCKEKNFPMYSTTGNWTAEYLNADDKWTVTFEFNAENLKRNYVWVVEDNNSLITDHGMK